MALQALVAEFWIWGGGAQPDFGPRLLPVPFPIPCREVSVEV